MLTAIRLRELLDYDYVTGVFTWRARKFGRPMAGKAAGCVSGTHRAIEVDGRSYMAHQLAWLYVHGKWAYSGIDHQDGDGQNNGIKNLRKANQSQNTANSKLSKANTVGLKGVRRSCAKWQARITKDGHTTHLGTFATPELAHAAYRAAAELHFGPFCRFS
jgi:HNH endonuclease